MYKQMYLYIAKAKRKREAMNQSGLSGLKEEESERQQAKKTSQRHGERKAGKRLW